MDIVENLVNLYKDKAQKFIENEIRKVNKILDTFPIPFAYQIELSETDISDEDYVAQVLFSEQYDIEILPIAINIQLLLQLMVDGYSFEKVKDEISISIWHEVGHGLLQRIEDDGYNCPWNYDNEQICQDFGKAKGNLNNSKLGRWIKEFNWQI